jgi:hypothetical protein
MSHTEGLEMDGDTEARLGNLRDAAERHRRQAEEAPDETARCRLLRTAEDYDRLARLIRANLTRLAAMTGHRG